MAPYLALLVELECQLLCTGYFCEILNHLELRWSFCKLDMLLPEKISSLFGDTFCPLLGQVVLVIVDEVVGVFH